MNLAFIRLLVVVGAAVGCAASRPRADRHGAARDVPGIVPDRPPNVVLVFADDLGYADLGVSGAQGYTTPNLDRMAAEGARLRSFYVAQAVCSASRAALMTGAYPNRVSILGALGPRSRKGLHHDEVTIAEVLKGRGYATAAYGKWHLGEDPRFLPRQQGFDEYFGLPYSNDMGPRLPERSDGRRAVPLVDNEQTVETAPDQSELTSRYTERALRFIERNQARPFFVYLAHNMPHVPIFASAKWKGTTARGLFGDVIAEIDWSVGQILATLARLGLDDRTLVIFSSDNGPWLSYGDHAGSARPLREGKATTFEGGVRVPALFRWPGRIPAGTVSDELVLSMDILPTLARLAGTPPAGRTIDGKDVWPILSRQAGAKTPHDAFFYYWGTRLEAVRSGPWKLHFPHKYRSLEGPGGRDGIPARYEERSIALSLFNLEADVGETTDVAAQHPDVVERLQALAERARADLGDSATGRVGKDIRPAGSAQAGSGSPTP